MMDFCKILIISFASFLCQAQEYSVMTYNLRLDVASDGDNDFNSRKENLVHQIQFFEPDIMGTQEGLPHQIKYLFDNLKGYEVFGEGRDGGNDGEAVSIFYKKKVFEVTNKNTFWLSNTPDRSSLGWDAKYLRICTFGLFKNRTTGLRFWVFNAHLDNVGLLARRNGLQLIKRKIAEFNSEKLPVIIMGDFNMEPDDSNIKALTEDFIDSRHGSLIEPIGPFGTFNNFSRDRPYNRRIDYIFISRESALVVKKYAVLDTSFDLSFPSDHFPVFALFGSSKN